MRIVLIFAFLITVNNIFSQSVVTVKVENPVQVKIPVQRDTVNDNSMSGIRVTYLGQSMGMIKFNDKIHDGLIVMDADTICRSASVVSFNMSVHSKDRDVIRLAATGPKLTEEMKKLLKTLETSDLIIFDTIKVRGANGVDRSFPSLSFRVNSKHIRY